MAHNQLGACSFIVGVDAKRAGQLSCDLANHCALGDNKFPQDLVSITETVKITMEKQLLHQWR